MYLPASEVQTISITLCVKVQSVHKFRGGVEKYVAATHFTECNFSRRKCLVRESF